LLSPLHFQEGTDLTGEQHTLIYLLLGRLELPTLAYQQLWLRPSRPKTNDHSVGRRRSC